MYSGYKWTTKLRFFASVLTIYAATLLFVVYSFWPGLFSRRTVAHSTPVHTIVPTEIKKDAITGKPKRIVIKSVDMDLPVIDGEYNPDDQSWTLSSKNAHFALPTAPANDVGGNTLIYGHNNRFAFGPLLRLEKGDEAIVYTDNGHIFRYTFVSSKDLKPDDTDIFSYEGDPILTLQTCTGNWYEKRSLYTFTLESAK